jgi:DNA-binding beta-propeller fold protein YncE
MKLPVLVFLTVAASLAGEPILPKLVQTIALPAVKGGFDLMAVDVQGKRLFLSAEDNNTMEVIDLAAGKPLRSVGGFHQPKWVVYRPELHKLYVSNGNGELRILDSSSFAPLKSLYFKEKANNLRYDFKTKQLFVGVGNTFGAIGIVNTKADVLADEIKVEGFPKQFELEQNRIFVNVPTANHIAVIDRERKAVVATWAVSEAKGNVPMGFDRSHHRLFIGCEPGKLVIFDTNLGKSVASLAIGAASDGVYYDAKRRQIYVSCGAGSIDVIQQIDPDHYKFAGRIPTADGAGTSLFVAAFDRLYLAVPQRDQQQAELRVYSIGR